MTAPAARATAAPTRRRPAREALWAREYEDRSWAVRSPEEKRESKELERRVPSHQRYAPVVAVKAEAARSHGTARE
jgi:hypothetical protein